ncbi:YbaN family protein [Acidimangrovimonas sediminis]|uniref:YbaN family protein n=1 Tax=Acidimangrovimonas sediminis TaxID=2056283 RepID=UPI000C7FC24F|nr:YbaN family protein [Acidimangrovimonas sediminis]
MRWLWAALGVVALALGALGIVLPLLPTVPFLLLAAFFFARSSERLHNWLITHPTLGPPIANWQRSGAISRRAKIAASVSILAAFSISVMLGLRPALLVIQAVVLIAVSLFIWTRPEG